MGEEAKIGAGRWVEGRRAVTAVQLVGVVVVRLLSVTNLQLGDVNVWAVRWWKWESVWVLDCERALVSL